MNNFKAQIQGIVRMKRIAQTFTGKAPNLTFQGLSWKARHDLMGALFNEQNPELIECIASLVTGALEEENEKQASEEENYNPFEEEEGINRFKSKNRILRRSA